MSATTAAQANKTLIRNLYEAINEKQDDIVPEFYSSDCVVYGAPGADAPSTGHEALQQQLDTTREAFPDLKTAIEAIVAEGDLVTVRVEYAGTHEGEYLGVPATGAAVQFNGTNMFRIDKGAITEAWPMVDTLGVLRQFGVRELPRP